MTHPASRCRLLLLCAAALTFCSLSTPLRAADWSRFRGPSGSAVSDDDKIPTEWSDTKNLAWKLEMPGAGFSSPIVVGDHVFVTCYTGGGRDTANLKRFLVCADRKSGKQLWSKTVPAAQPEFTERGGFAHHGYASSTPVSDGEHVYVLFGTTGAICFDLKGNQVWKKEVGKELRSTFGSAASPILYKNLVIVTAANESETIYAFDKKTGKEVWKAPAAPLSEIYNTPLILKNKEGEDELLVFVPGEVWGMNPENGKLRWYAEFNQAGNVCTSLVAAGDVVYAVGGGGRGARPGKAAIRIGGTDDAKANVLWQKRDAPYVPSPVYYKDHLYWISDRGIASVINAKTGESVTEKRIGGQFYASMVVIKDKLYAVSRFGGTYVFEGDPKLKEIARNRFSDTSDFSGSPAVSDGQLFIRSDKYLYCIQAK